METQEPLKAGGERFVRSDSFEWLSRAGFAARGTVYLIIGILAIKLALGNSGSSASQQGAMRAIAAQPFGQVLLILVAIGLGGYALWRLVRGLLGHGPEGSDSGIDRVAALASGVVYAGLLRDRRRDPARRRFRLRWRTEDDLRCLWLARRNLAGRDRRRRADRRRPLPGIPRTEQRLPQGLRRDRADEPTRPPLDQVDRHCRVPSRMVVFCLVGAFLIHAAVDYNPNQAVGLDGALAKIDHAS